MESATVKPSKPSPNISDMVSKFAKVCKLRSTGVFSNENPNQHHCHHSPNGKSKSKSNRSSAREDSSDATEDTECDGEKIHPDAVGVPSKAEEIEDKDMTELFNILSALKLAYVQLQGAHLPYDPDKIIAADAFVVKQLEALCKIKRAYKEKQFKRVELGSCRLDSLRTEIEVNEKLLKKLKSENRAKDAEIVRLQQELLDLDLGNTMLVEKMRQLSLERQNNRVLNIAMFEDAFKAASKSIHDFAKPVISLMRATGWDLELAANAIENGVIYSKKPHKKYAFEAYITRRMFYGISLRSYSVGDVMRFDDPIDSLIMNPNSGFGDFCRKRYLFVVHPAMEMSFFGNLDHRIFVLSGKHPRTQFYQIFARMAKWIWVLQGIAASIDPKAEMFSVSRGSPFSDVYMESVEENMEDGGHSTFKVELMVTPGFRFGETLMKARVYLSEMKPSSATS